MKYFQPCFRNIAKFRAHLDKLVKKIVTSGKCLQFPEIPAKFRENYLTGKSTISVELCKNHRNSQKSTEIDANTKPVLRILYQIKSEAKIYRN